jgi:hypothetical protein
MKCDDAMMRRVTIVKQRLSDGARVPKSKIPC